MTDYSKPAGYDPSDWDEVQRRQAMQAEHSQAREGHRHVTFVAPAARPPRPAEIMPAPAQTVDLSAAWQPTESPSRDSISAVDRAKAVHIRAFPIYAAVAGIAVVAVILYSITLWFTGWQGAPYALDRVLIFVGTLTALGLWQYLRLNKQEFDHSHAGVERLRIETAGEIQLAIIEAETEIKLKALNGYLKLLGVEENGSGPYDR